MKPLQFVITDKYMFVINLENQSAMESVDHGQTWNNSTRNIDWGELLILRDKHLKPLNDMLDSMIERDK